MFWTGDNPRKPMEYEYHRRLVARIFKKAGIDSASVTHAFRGSSARAAEELDIHLSDIAAVGKWVRDSLVNHYVYGTPPNAALKIAGFSGDGKDVVIGRSIPQVTFDLQELAKKHIFPWAEEALAFVHEEREQHKKKDIAACCVLKALINACRRVVLEDLAALSQRYPDHPYVKRSPICKEQVFKEYAEEVGVLERGVRGLELDVFNITPDKVRYLPQYATVGVKARYCR